ncbi:MAG: hypothetical protein QG657_3503 [Acidobacteriota bacterium]|nr:hypothetical protein [Acidobacteriota bacterium]
MKPKTLTKKLVLSKSTIANLHDRDMKAIIGGATEVTDCLTICETWCAACNTVLETKCIRTDCLCEATYYRCW